MADFLTHTVEITLTIWVTRAGPQPLLPYLLVCQNDEANAIAQHLLETWNDDDSILAIAQLNKDGSFRQTLYGKPKHEQE